MRVLVTLALDMQGDVPAGAGGGVGDRQGVSAQVAGPWVGGRAGHSLRACQGGQAG